MKTGKMFSLVFIRSYQILAGPTLGGGCRFEPSCSRYAEEALEKHGLILAWNYIIKRILRCRPGGGCGHDPVPLGRVNGRKK